MKTIGNHAGFALLSLTLFNLLPLSPALAFSYSIQIDTPSLSGTAAQPAFDFIDGGPPL